MKRFLPKILPVLLILAFLPMILAPHTAQARVKRITALRFVEMYSLSDYLRTPLNIGCPAGSSYFTARVRLPVGAVIDSVTMYESMLPGSLISVGLLALPTPPVTVLSTLAFKPSNDVSPNINDPIPIPVPFLPGADLTVKSGYTYFLAVVMVPNGYLWEVDIAYHRP